MHRAAVVALGLATAGCWGFQTAVPEGCSKPTPWADERTTRSYEPKAPTPARPESLTERHITVKPGSVNLPAIADETFDLAAKRRDVESLAGWLLTCRAQSEGLVATDVFTGADLLVYTTLAARKYPQQSGAALVYADPLRKGDAMHFLLNDDDVWSKNDYVGEARGTYEGHVPFKLDGKNALIECRGLPPELVNDRLSVAKRAVDKHLIAMESFEGTLDAPLPFQDATALEALLAEVVFYEGSASPMPADVEERAKRISQALWGKHQERVATLAERRPGPRTWVKVSERLEARSIGLSCAADVSCRIDLELRVVPGEASLGLCDFERDALERMNAYAWTGDASSAHVESMAVGGRTVTNRSELIDLPVGSIVGVRVAVAPGRGVRSAEAWDLPLLTVGDAVLRLH